LEVIVSICTVVLTIIAIVELVRSKNQKK